MMAQAGPIEQRNFERFTTKIPRAPSFFVKSRDRETKILLGVLGVFVVRIALKFQIR